MNVRRISGLVGALLVGLLLLTPVHAQPSPPPCERSEFFPQTGHSVCDRFLDFFQTRGGVEIFGYPITEQFIENGRLVQYFQRVRMEHHPENPPPYQVQLGLLGDMFAPAEQKARIVTSPPPASDDKQRYFPETQHVASYGFLEFFDSHGGLDIFGYPVTEPFLENGRFVQYFQRALMEWDHNQERIVLHDLGSMWVEQHENLRARTAPVQLAPASPVLELRTVAAVRDAVTRVGNTQTVWVFVYDQNGRPVEGATVDLRMYYLTHVQSIPMPPTDRLGHTEIEFEVDVSPRGQLVIVEARVTYGDLTPRAFSSFFLWQ